MSSLDKVVAIIQHQLKQSVEIKPESLLVQDLRLDSLGLVEITLRIHSEHGVDIGRKAAELQKVPETVGDIVDLLEAA